MNPAFENVLLAAAEEHERRNNDFRIGLLKETYDYLRSIGLSEESARRAMALNSQQMGALRRK